MAGSAIQRTTSAVKTDNEILALIYTTNVYKRNVVFSGGADTDAASRRSLVTPADMIVGINGSFYRHTSSSTLDLNTAGNWNSSETTYATAANRAGKDVYIYACESGSTAPDIVLSCDSSYPDDYTAATSRKIGGFHCLCASVGTISGHDLTGYLQGDILPLSVWDLLHRAKSSNEGMVYDDALKIWVDIYLNSLSGGEVVSEYGGTPHSGGEGANDFHWYNWVEHLAAVGKRLPYQHEFMHFSLGSNQETNVAGDVDTGTTGGQSDAAGDRMISNYGAEDCCGMMWQWGADTAATPGASAYAVADVDGTANSYDDTNSIGRGQHYEAPERPLLGGPWGGGVVCGSRCSTWDNVPLILSAASGARGVCEPRVVHLD